MTDGPPSKKKNLKSCTSENPKSRKKNQYSRTIGPSMAPLELLLKRQAVIFKAPSAYIGLELILIKIKCPYCFLTNRQKNMDLFLKN